jgi:hypothetical protein
MPHPRFSVTPGLVAIAALGLACGTVEGDLTDAQVAVDAAGEADAAPPDATPPDATPVDCEPNTTVCDGDVLVRCDETGSGEPETCLLGCHATEERCNDLAPSNGLADVLDADPPNGDLVLGNNTVIDTTGGTVEVGGREVVVVTSERAASSGGVAARVIRARSLIIGSAVVRGDRGLVIVTDGPIEIRGTLDISGAAGGAGSLRDTRLACAGNAPTTAPNVDGVYLQAGGGGGGFGAAGGAGGTAAVPGTSSPGGAGGALAGNGAITPFRGGCPGGGAVVNNEVEGGAGGGAIHLVSRTAIRLVSTGVTPGFIDAGGQGGRSAANETRFGNAGSGGGAGGAILLEAPAVSLVSNTGLTANGGGGGCGLAGAGGSGQNGLRTAAPAAGATCTAKGRGNGGAGASAAVPVAAAGGNGTAAGGGGGGGLGRIAIKNKDMVFTTPDGATVSPNAAVDRAGVR